MAGPSALLAGDEALPIERGMFASPYFWLGGAASILVWTGIALAVLRWV
ncbi:MAG: hypothetical protein ACXWC2_01275 [Ramlibacter sp.]